MQNIDEVGEYPISAYNFRYHKKYFEGLKASLEPFEIYLDKIRISYTKRGLKVFEVITTGEKPIIWRNVKSKSMNSHNDLHIGKNVFKLMDWLSYSHDYRAEIINKANETNETNETN